MKSYFVKKPILLLTFNRPELTKQLLDKIKIVKPKDIFVACDGSRENVKDEDKKVNQVRKIIKESINWECKTRFLFQENNLGCKKAVSQAIDWFFDEVEEGIILEDDCIPNVSFFRYCDELLDKYKENEKIMCITGDNFQFNNIRGDASYYFSVFSHCWGWATWRRAWKHFDVTMETFPKFQKTKQITNIFDTKKIQKYWENVFKKVYAGEINSWAYIWMYTCWINNGLTCLPNKNLVSNMGFGSNSTHTRGDSSIANLKAEEIKFPLQHPKFISRDTLADDYTMNNIILPGLSKKLFSTFQKILNKTT